MANTRNMQKEIILSIKQSIVSDLHQPVVKNIEYGDTDKACFYLEKHILYALDRIERAQEKRLTQKIHTSFSRMETFGPERGTLKNRS